MTDLSKPTKLTLTIAPDYVDWGIWESIRELMQNAMDADDLGQKMLIEYSGGTLHISNKGASIDRRALLLGGSQKAGTSSRGKFGEGMKLAFASLVNKGLTVNLWTGTESWVPILESSEEFGGAKLLKIVAGGDGAYTGQLSVFVDGVDEESWAMIQQRLLFLKEPDPAEVFKVASGSILTSLAYSNMLFVKGIYVSQLPDNYRFGYDLRDVELDRDRKLADPWTLKSAIKETLKRAVSQNLLTPKEMISHLETEECGESKIFYGADFCSTAPSFYSKVATAWKASEGEDSIPVSTAEESAMALLIGKKPVQVTRSTKRVLEESIGPLGKLVEKAQEGVSKYYLFGELDASTLLIIWNSCEMIRKVDRGFSMDMVRVVDFFGDLKSFFDKENLRINISKLSLKDIREVVRLLVKEMVNLHLLKHFGADSIQTTEDFYLRMLDFPDSKKQGVGGR